MKRTFVWYNVFGDKMRIDKIKKLKSGKYKLFIDNNEEIITHGDVILKNNLLSEVKISRDLLLKITTDTEYYNIDTLVKNKSDFMQNIFNKIYI